MNISEASVKLTSEDIKSIIEDFLKVPGLSITSVSIDKFIEITGAYKKIIKLSFKLSVSIVHITKNSISLKLEKAKVAMLPIFSWVRNIVLKKLMKTLKQFGVSFSDGMVDMHIAEVLENLPITVNLQLKSIELSKDSVYIEAEKILLNINKEEKTTKTAENRQAVTGESVIVKNSSKEDLYGEIRKSIDDKASKKFKGLLPYIMVMPDIIALFIRLFRDKRVPLKVKIICGSVMTYLALPIDVFPDFLPVVGKIDDVALAFYALDKILCSLPKEIIIDNWQGKEDIILFIRSGADYLYRVIGASNVVKGYKWLAAILKLKNTKSQQDEEKEKLTDAEEGLRD